MEKTKPAVIRTLDVNYKKACNAYVTELARLWDFTLNAGCFWIGDEPGGVFDFDSAFTLGMEDIIYSVRHSVSPEQAVCWQEYVCWAEQNGFEQPSLRDYCEARVPLVPEEAQQRITEARQNLMRLCDEERDRIGCRRREHNNPSADQTILKTTANGNSK